jgi:hypothetical protein
MEGIANALTWTEQDFAAPAPDEQLLAVNEVLDNLARIHPVQAEVVKLRYFAGMTNEETAQGPGCFCCHGKELLGVRAHLDFQRDQEALVGFAGAFRRRNHSGPGKSPFAAQCIPGGDERRTQQR